MVQSPTHEESDAFELKYSRNWLELVLQFNSKLLVKAVEDVAEAELENIISITSNLLSSISGHCG